MLAVVVLWMLGLAPRAPADRIAPLAAAIADVAASDAEAAELTMLAFVETSLGRAGIPFGLSCRGCRRDAAALDTAAARALRILRRARLECGPSLEARQGYYRTGRCRVDGEAQRRAAIVRRLLRRRARR